MSDEPKDQPEPVVVLEELADEPLAPGAAEAATRWPAALPATSATAPALRPPSQAWLVTFTDLIALMLTFMVLLFAMSKVEQRRWQNLVDALTQNLNAVREMPAAAPTATLDVEDVETLPGFDLDYLSALLSQNLAADPLLSDVLLTRMEGRLVIALPSALLFESGSVQPSARAPEVLNALAGQLRYVGNKIEVAGHADPRPPGGGIPSNWELSLARARNVAFLLNAAGLEGRIVARGYGHSRFDSLSQKLQGARRLVIGRRVEVVIHDYREALP
ncbi:MAG: flagellar motor protein MotB [Kiloniellales bacterium]|nr:flagellar motor protein MotB [Kiloniellales bacterium]